MGKTAAIERRDLRLRPILGVGGLLLLGLALVSAVVGGLLHSWGVPHDAGANAAPDVHPAGSVLLPAPQDERAAYDAEQEQRLHGYAWVDRQAGLARIPIEVAMEMLIARSGASGGAASGRGEKSFAAAGRSYNGVRRPKEPAR